MKNISATIQFLKNREVDRERWDECIEKCDNALIYARSFYLDNMSSGWSGLVGKNYDWVYPLTHKSKYGIRYLYQPPFTQQLGVFAKPGIKVPYDAIVEYLQRKYRFWEINWNFATPTSLTTLSLEVKGATNFILDLSAGKNVAANYHSDLVKNLKRSRQFKHRYLATDDFKECIELYKRQYEKRMPHVKEDDYKNFHRLCTKAMEKNSVVCRKVVNGEDVPMATALLLFDGKRLYNLMNTTTEAGRKTEANHFLLNAVIEEFSDKGIVLDFEGSDLQGVRRFYQNFGAFNQPYFKIKYNDLPWPLKVFKK